MSDDRNHDHDHPEEELHAMAITPTLMTALMLDILLLIWILCATGIIPSSCLIFLGGGGTTIQHTVGGPGIR